MLKDAEDALFEAKSLHGPMGLDEITQFSHRITFQLLIRESDEHAT
jgi:hypothetical protein